MVIENYECDEVVYVGDKTSTELQRLGYVTDNVTIEKGGTYILHRKNCFLHSVKPMEKLRDIAEKYNKTAEQLRADNNLATDKLYIGQILVIY